MSHSLDLTDVDLAETRAFNARLARMPRLRLRNRLEPKLMQALLRLSQVGADRRVRRMGVVLETHVAEADGLRVPVRVLRPAGALRGVVLDIHGGAWALGNARLDDRFNLPLAQECGVAVVSIDYRLAPDTPIEGLMDDCLAAARWLLDGGLPDLAGLPVIVTGESAGGHLAAATLLRLKTWRELFARVVGAVLYYGVYDLAGTPSVHAAGPETLVLDGPGMVSAMRQLTPVLDDPQRRQPPLSPLYGDLTGMPPAFMTVGSIDPLRDDTLLMAERWRAVGPVELHVLPEAPHGFLHFRTGAGEKLLQAARHWIDERLTHAGTVSP